MVEEAAQTKYEQLQTLACCLPINELILAFK
ncbi:unnamed protein product, partial [Rotaria sp. Silwood2]